MAEKKRISFLREEAAATGNGSFAVLAAPPEFVLEYPALAEYLTALAFPTGKERETSTLTLLVEDGKLKGCVNDRAQERGLWRSADTLGELLAALEAALENPDSQWRKWNRGYKGRVPGK